MREAAWLPQISHRFLLSLSDFCCFWLYYYGRVYVFLCQSPKLLNFLSKKVVIFIYYVFLKKVEILHALSLWGRRVPRGCCLTWKSWRLSNHLCSFLECLGKEIRFSLFSWGPMLVEIFCLFLNSFMVHSDTGRKIGEWMGRFWSSLKEDIRRFPSPTGTFWD